MAMIPSSKVIDLSDKPAALDSVVEWFNNAITDVAYKRVKLVLEPAERQKKLSAKQELEATAVDGETAWESGDYRFSFLGNKYLWKNEEIYITAGEALYLYKRLVLKEEQPRRAFYLGHMRKRLGKEFLAEIREA